MKDTIKGNMCTVHVSLGAGGGGGLTREICKVRLHLPLIGVVQEAHFLANRLQKHSRQ